MYKVYHNDSVCPIDYVKDNVDRIWTRDTTSNKYFCVGISKAARRYYTLDEVNGKYGPLHVMYFSGTDPLILSNAITLADFHKRLGREVAV